MANYYNPYAYTGYAPYMPNSTTVPVGTYPQYQQQNPSFAWVQGIESAKAYNVPAGSSMMLMDSEHPVIYVKTVDSTGKPQELEIYDMVKRKNSKPKSQSDDSSITSLIEDTIDKKFEEYGIYKRHKKEDK